MPELPEVETTRRGVSPQLEGATVRGMLLRQPSLRWPVPPAKMTAMFIPSPLLYALSGLQPR